MPVEIWPIRDFTAKFEEHADKEFDAEHEAEKQDYLRSARELGQRAILRGDGLAVYVNSDLGHPDIGQWQVVSFGSSASQLETRDVLWGTPPHNPQVFSFGSDNIPTTLPDIGGRINWRYTLHAIVPSGEQRTSASRDESACSHPGCVYREGHDLDTFPHRVEGGTPHDRLVVVQVKVSGGATEEEAKSIVEAAVLAGLRNWRHFGGDVGEKTLEAEYVDTVVI